MGEKYRRGWRDRLFGVTPAKISLDLSADTKAKVVQSVRVPAPEWDQFSRTLTAANKGTREGSEAVSAARKFLASWGIDSLLDIGRDATSIGNPFRLKAEQGLRHIVTPAELNGGPAVQITVDRLKKPGSPPSSNGRVLASR